MALRPRRAGPAVGGTDDATGCGALHQGTEGAGLVRGHMPKPLPHVVGGEVLAGRGEGVNDALGLVLPVGIGVGFHGCEVVKEVSHNPPPR